MKTKKISYARPKYEKAFESCRYISEFLHKLFACKPDFNQATDRDAENVYRLAKDLQEALDRFAGAVNAKN